MDNKTTQGGGAKRRPLRFYCCPFVKDFLRNIRTKGLTKKIRIINAERGLQNPLALTLIRAYDNTFSLFVSRGHFREPGIDPGEPGPTLGTSPGGLDPKTFLELFLLCFSTVVYILS